MCDRMKMHGVNNIKFAFLCQLIRGITGGGDGGVVRPSRATESKGCQNEYLKNMIFCAQEI